MRVTSATFQISLLGFSAHFRWFGGSTIDGWGDAVYAEDEEVGVDDESVVEVPVEPRELSEVDSLEEV